MNWTRSALLRGRTTLSRPLRRRTLRRLSARGEAPCSVLFYHRVADEHGNDWTIGCRQFRRHVDYCRRHFELVGLDEVQRRVHSGQSPRPTVTFTFDDGYADNCRYALPLLIRHRIPTVYFVSVGHVVDQHPFPHDVKAGQPLAVNTPDQLRWAAAGGLEIGLHTRSHVDFSVVRDPRTIRQEIVDAKAELEGIVARPVRFLAVPYGMPEQLSQAVIDATHEAGLLGFCSAFGAYNLPGRDSFHIRRIHGDPEFARLENWLTFDRRKLRHEPIVPYLMPPGWQPPPPPGGRFRKSGEFEPEGQTAGAPEPPNAAAPLPFAESGLLPPLPLS